MNSNILGLMMMVNFDKQRAITLVDMVRYGPLSNLKKKLRYYQCDQVS